MPEYTASALQDYLKCPSLYMWKYKSMVDVNLPPISHKSKALDMGTAMHEALESILNREEYRPVLMKYPPYIRGKAIGILEARRLLENDLEHFNPITPISVEVILKGKIGRHTIRGKLDAIGKILDKVLILDHKTSGNFYKKDAFRLSLQRTIYTELALQNQIKVDGFMIHLIVVPRHSMNTGELEEDYTARITKLIYEREMGGYKTPHFSFHQFEHDEFFHKQQLLKVEALLDTIDNTDLFYQNPLQCFQFGECPCFGLCSGAYNLEQVGKKKYTHPELQVKN